MRVFTSVYIILLIYIIVALVFWEISLQKQSGQIYAQQLITLKNTIDSTNAPVAYGSELISIQHGLNSRTKQYAGEGATFLFVILIGAFVVYRSFLRSMWLSRQQNNFMLSVTHELKSPIAAIKLNLQTIEKHRLDDDIRKKLAQRSIIEANRLNDLCNNLLITSQIEGRQYKPIRERLSLPELVQRTVKDYMVRYPGRITIQLINDCHIFGDNLLLEMALSNLLENALKYSDNHALVRISLFTKQDKAIIQVKDNGTGIPDKEKKNIFKKFYRIGNEENRKTKGTGLGLYLVNKIVKQHKGSVSVMDNTPTGCIFEIALMLGN